MGNKAKEEFRLFPGFHFAITTLIEHLGKEDRKFYAIKANEEKFYEMLSGEEEQINKTQKELELIKEEEEQKMLSLEALSGSLLQILKANIYTNYRTAQNSPKGRFIFSRLPSDHPISVRDIILSGRIQYNHPERIDDEQTINVFNALALNFDEGIEDESKKMFTLEEGKVLAYNIVSLLNWTSYKGEFEKDMILIFDPNFERVKRAILGDKRYLYEDRKRLLSYLRWFAMYKNNNNMESTEEVLKVHDAIGVKAELVLGEIKTNLLGKSGNNNKQKKELAELLKICDLKQMAQSVYKYN
ncbi:hypothetical protein [Halobacillus sp. K22]|uniref:hypothetical protein n=1 Tax=Halobacillus sp. K22 TaxID=3457431 RepID=UPI003FCC9C64